VTEKLYYQDPSLLEFDASITEDRENGALHELVLDRTCFFPGGGGQPADRGTLGGARVVDMRERDDEIVHVVDGHAGAPGSRISGHVDAERRRAFMAQHTGQHILSQALLTAGELPTVSVHFGDETTTIELDAQSVPEAVLRQAESIANGIITENRPIRVHEVDPKDAGRFPLRRTPPQVGRLRIVEVDSYDWAACSGLHVTRTGQIGLIKVVGQEKIRGRARIHALIGARAMEDYGRKIAIVQALTRVLTCGEADIPARVEELVKNARDAARELERLKVEAAAGDAEAAVAHARRLGGAILVRRDLRGAGSAYCKAFAERVVSLPGRAVVVLDSSPTAFQWIIAHSLGEGVQLPALVTPLLAPAQAKGGGRAAWIQGAGRDPGSATAFGAAVEEALGRALAASG
jgi:alanyl-tRNA synthetase